MNGTLCTHRQSHHRLAVSRLNIVQYRNIKPFEYILEAADTVVFRHIFVYYFGKLSQNHTTSFFKLACIAQVVSPLFYLADRLADFFYKYDFTFGVHFVRSAYAGGKQRQITAY